MTPISRLVAVSFFAVLVAASSPVALSQAAQGSSDERQEFSSLLARAEKGDASAQFMLGTMYFNGEGVPKNDAEAVKWYRLAADRGYAIAQVSLGNMYGKGEGVPKNDAEAYFWWNLAAAQGIEQAKNNRDIIEKEMSREQISEAQRRSAAWKPKK
jgi:TPR repeat protein